MPKRSAWISHFEPNPHSEASAEEAEAAESISEAAQASPGSGCLPAGVAVGVKVIATEQADRARDDLGRARLLDGVAIGRQARISLDSDSLLVTSEVRAIVEVRPGGFWVTTANTTYLLEVLGSSE
jgi:hypothetical protein